MQNYTTIIGVIELRLNGCSYDTVQKRYSIGSSTVTLIMNRFREIGLSLDDIRPMEPGLVEDTFYPKENLQRKNIPMPDFQKYYDRLMTKGSKVNLFYLWLDYKKENPDGYQTTQFYEYFNRFVKENFGGKTVSMPIERVPGEKMYIDWIGDKPELLVDINRGNPVSACVHNHAWGQQSCLCGDISE